jgi:hypothetical protein
MLRNKGFKVNIYSFKDLIKLRVLKVKGIKKQI